VWMADSSSIAGAYHTKTRHCYTYFVTDSKCEYCGKEEGYFEVHHVKKLANIQKGVETWKRLMMARKRKTLVLCVECHDRLHAGTLPDVRGLKLGGEPCAAISCQHGSEGE